jgi:hypothetical protein
MRAVDETALGAVIGGLGESSSIIEVSGQVNGQGGLGSYGSFRLVRELANTAAFQPSAATNAPRKGNICPAGATWTFAPPFGIRVRCRPAANS